MCDIICDYRKSGYKRVADYIANRAPWLLLDIGQAESFLFSTHYSEDEKIAIIEAIHFYRAS